MIFSAKPARLEPNVGVDAVSRYDWYGVPHHGPHPASPIGRGVDLVVPIDASRFQPRNKDSKVLQEVQAREPERKG